MGISDVEPIGDENVAQPGFDTSKRFVRITNERADGFVEFDFAIGEPEIFVEMVLSRAAYEEFQQANNAIVLTGDDDPDDMHFRLADVSKFD